MEVAALDEVTAFAVQEVLAVRWAIAPADQAVRAPGEPGVRLRFFLDLHQEGNTATTVADTRTAGGGGSHPR